MIALQEVIGPTNPDNVVTQLLALGWVDKTGLSVLLVFFFLGLFKGLLWQVSRIGILVAAYFVAGRFGHGLAVLLSSSGESSDPVPTTPDTTIYLAYCMLFIAVLVVLSLVSMMLKKLVDKAGLSFYDRLGGGVLGVATGCGVILAAVFVLNMFFAGSQLALAADKSHSMRFCQKTVNWMGGVVPDELRGAIGLPSIEPGKGEAQGTAPAGEPAPERGRTNTVR